MSFVMHADRTAPRAPTRRLARAGFLTALALAGATLLSPNTVRAQEAGGDGAVILMYHRFGEEDYPSSNIRAEQFDEHINELKAARYKVRPLPEIVDALASGRRLEDRTVAITVDDAFLSVHATAWPKLKAAGFPVTLFVATGAIDRKTKGYMSWDQIRELRDAGVTIGSQTHSHPHMPALDGAAMRRELDLSNQRFMDELGARPTLFAYPYGEFSLATIATVKAAGFKAAFGQHSGVAHGRGDLFSLPRFSLNERYGGIDRFRLIVNALPLPVADILPKDALLGENPPAFGFTVDPAVGGTELLSCFSSSEGETHLERLAQRVEVRLKSPLPPGRSRINCTMPGPDNRWRWLGIQFVVPE